MRGGWLVLILSGVVVLLGCPLPAAAREPAEPVSRADHLAAQLRRDPVYVTDHTPRVLPPDAAARIKASVARLGVPAYVAVTPTVHVAQEHTAEALVALLRDRLREDGVYIVISPSSTYDGEVRQFGGGRRLPVEDAWRATTRELPNDATAPERIERFVDVALSGEARERADTTAPPPKSALRKALDADEAADRRAARAEWAAFAGGTALSGLPILGLLICLHWRKRSRSRR
ncbi:hypothetical protein E1200_03975 [Actinomadura sp. GC306]|uniref:hypothetical protein n=1 Tax=Actinomadura sp. GC306 TaxID=2530367 RepID=UPI001048040C|nr:hypothetical protein [Actinomadura sp. GC306]TDC70901.1 hypothetical protein E1200_03975 [Actinomadura sp. GC306]